MTLPGMMHLDDARSSDNHALHMQTRHCTFTIIMCVHMQHACARTHTQPRVWPSWCGRLTAMRALPNMHALTVCVSKVEKNVTDLLEETVANKLFKEHAEQTEQVSTACS